MTPEKPKHPGGRPLKFLDPQDIQIKADKFFIDCDDKKIPYTITGLAIELGFNSRQQLLEYEDRGEFHDTIKRAKARCERFAEEKMYGNNAAGPIFALKNYGWKDKQEVSHEVAGIEDILTKLQGK